MQTDRGAGIAFKSLDDGVITFHVLAQLGNDIARHSLYREIHFLLYTIRWSQEEEAVLYKVLECPK